jgi:hypothetical protein
MILDGALANAQIRGDVFTGMTGENEIENLPLTRCQAIEMRGPDHAPVLGLIGPKLRFWPSWRTFRECVLSD